MADATPDKAKVSESLKQLIHSACLSRLKSSSKITDLQEQSMDPTENNSVLAHWMSLILISGRALRVTLKAHFMSADAKVLACEVYGKKPEEIEVAQASDFIKEFSNLSGGALKKAMEGDDSPLGISLPLVMRGADEIFFPMAGQDVAFIDRWKIYNAHTSIICSAIVEIYDFAALQAIPTNIDDMDSSDDGIEFL